MAGYAVSLYHSLLHVDPYPVQCRDWEELITCIGVHQPYLDKKEVALFAPHTLMPGATVSKEAVTSIPFGVIDLDNRGQKDVPWTEDQICELLAGYDCPFVFASSWSHEGPHKTKGRVLVPFSRPLLPSEWDRFWLVFNDQYANGFADHSCKDSSHRYYRPAYREGGITPIYIRSDDGLPIDVDRLLMQAPHAVESTLGTTPTRDNLRWFADRLIANKKTETLGRALKAVVRGDSFADAGDRDTMLFKLTSKIISRWPSLDPEPVADIFAPSLAIMGSDGPDVAKAMDMLQRHQRGFINRRAERISRAFRSDRKEPYSQEELHALADRFGCDVVDLRHRWVIQRGSSYYLLVDGQYRLYTDKDVSNAALTDLAPAISAQVDPEVTTDKAVRTKSPPELIKDYGSVATGVDIDMCAQFSYFDSERGVMVEAPCPIRVEPVYNAQIDKWIELLGGRQAVRLKQWLAAITRLDKPSSALYLKGPGGVGKTLLALGVARIWTTEGPVALTSVFSDFNDRVSKCPLVFGDEVMPEVHRGQVRMSSKLREFIQGRHRDLKRKFMPEATVKGAARLILAANNDQLLQTTEHLTPEDIAAIVERFFFLSIEGDEDNPPPARVFLNSLSKGTTEQWVNGDAIARHVLWLRDNVSVSDQGRFLVSGEGGELTRSLATNSGLRAGVCNWLVNFLLNPSVVVRKPEHSKLIRVRENRLLVNAKIITELWEDYVKNDRNPPGPTQVSNALSGLSHRRITVKESGHVINYRDVNLDNLAAWAENTGYATADRLAMAVAELDEA